MKKINKLVRKNILSLQPYSSERNKFKNKESILLDANENPYGILNRYPDPYQKKLKNKISKIKKISYEQIFIGNGSDEIIDIIIRLFCIPEKDKVLSFSPTFGMYEVLARINNVKYLKINLNREFQINKSDLNNSLNQKNLKLLIICTPNNPTGNSIRNSDINFILKNFKGIVIIDEAYIDFNNSKSYIEKVEGYSNLIVLQTLSKAWGLASVRIGIAYSNKYIVELMNKIKLPYNVSTLNQQAALLTLNSLKKYKENVKLIINEKKKLVNILSEIQIVKKVFPSDSNFLLIEFEDADNVFKKLIKKKIITRNLHPAVKNCIRISVGNIEENRKLIKTLNKISK
jgi:histidinol-phosphate aminotransferase